MRTARLKPLMADATGTTYHLFNRAVGEPDELPFGPDEKEMFIQLLHRYAILYTVEILAWVVMGNHFHILLFAPAVEPTPEETVRRYAAFHGTKRAPLDPASPQCRKLMPRLRDISWFMHDLQGQFTTWFNHHDGGTRRGTIWQGRFKSPVIEGVSSLWHCLEYIEMNSVRARLVSDPADYRFSSWGAWCGTGCHPYADLLLNHLRRVRGEHTAAWTLADFQRELRQDFARVSTGEAGGTTAQIEQAVAEAAAEPPLLTVLDRRVRYWTDGLIIGGRRFILAIMAPYLPPERLERHRLSPPTRLESPRAQAPPLNIHAWRRFRHHAA